MASGGEVLPSDLPTELFTTVEGSSDKASTSWQSQLAVWAKSSLSEGVPKSSPKRYLNLNEYCWKRLLSIPEVISKMLRKYWAGGEIP